MKDLALKIVTRSFKDKKDKAGKPYVEHLIRVSNKVSGSGFHEDIGVIALLHDLLEDCMEWNEDVLRVFFSDRIVDVVVILTRKMGESYDSYIDRVLTDYWASLVKRADLEDNMDLTRLPEITQKDIERVVKYHKAYKRVIDSLN